MQFITWLESVYRPIEFIVALFCGHRLVCWKSKDTWCRYLKLAAAAVRQKFAIWAGVWPSRCEGTISHLQWVMEATLNIIGYGTRGVCAESSWDRDCRNWDVGRSTVVSGQSWRSVLVLARFTSRSTSQFIKPYRSVTSEDSFHIYGSPQKLYILACCPMTSCKLSKSYLAFWLVHFHQFLA